MDPPVSDPIAMKQRPAATAAAEPPDETPGLHCTFQGLRTGGKSTPQAASLMVVLPSKMAPACFSRSQVVACWVGIRRANTCEPLRVGIPRRIVIVLKSDRDAM